MIKMKFTSIISLLMMLVLALSVSTAPVPSSTNANDCGNSCIEQTSTGSFRPSAFVQVSKREGGPVLPLPAPGEPLLSYLDRLLSGLPLLGHLMEGLGYVRPTKPVH
ncbi:hypothetical protein BX667DRAFT_500007 [Coemansia mojavensis]|nr:hypothetical protein BX667DRAFT_500007 [Coemansia mojavensis]